MSAVNGMCVAAALIGCASSAVAVDGVFIKERIYNDFPNSTLVTTDNYPAQVKFDESNFGSGGWANRHSAYFSSTGGATPRDYNYHDDFDITLNLDLDYTTNGSEAGFHTDLFGFGFFGVLPNGEIAAFGSILPFKTFGNVWTPGQPVSLRMIHVPGNGDGVNQTVNPSTIEYIYDLGGGPVSSGPIDFNNFEGGIPSNFDLFVGFGVQNQGAGGGTSVADFTRINYVPAPGAAALLGLGALSAARRRR